MCSSCGSSSSWSSPSWKEQKMQEETMLPHRATLRSLSSLQSPQGQQVGFGRGSLPDFLLRFQLGLGGTWFLRFLLLFRPQRRDWDVRSSGLACRGYPKPVQGSSRASRHPKPKPLPCPACRGAVLCFSPPLGLLLPQGSSSHLSPLPHLLLVAGLHPWRETSALSHRALGQQLTQTTCRVLVLCLPAH